MAYQYPDDFNPNSYNNIYGNPVGSQLTTIMNNNTNNNNNKNLTYNGVPKAYYMEDFGNDIRMFRKRDPEPTELNTLRQGIYNNVLSGLQGFNPNAWKQAQNTTNEALKQQNSLTSMLPDYLKNNQNISNEILNLVRTGNTNNGVAQAMNAATNKELQSSLGNMLNSLGNRGVVNSSITSQAINQLGENAADAYNKNYLEAYNAALSGYGQAMQSGLSNTQSLLSGINALGTIPSQAWEGAYAGLMPAFNFWKNWQGSYDGREDFDIVVPQETGGGGGGACLTGDTLVTLSNGFKVKLSNLKNTDEIKAWDFDKGCETSAPLTAFFKRTYEEPIDVYRVKFEDGSTIGVIYEHLFFDLTEGKFIAVNANNYDYVGHSFAKVTNEGNIVPLKVVDIVKEVANSAYSPQCKGHFNFLAGEGVISGTGGQLGICNMFDFDTEAMTYHKDKKFVDLQKYGKLDYEEFKDIMQREFFDANHVDEVSVAIGKGLLTLEQLKAYLRKFSHCFLQ